MNLNVNTGIGTRDFTNLASHFFCEMKVGLDVFSDFFPALKHYDLYDLFLRNHVLKSFL